MEFHQLFAAMSEGVCLHDMVYDGAGTAVDYRVIDVNPAYERITGLKKATVTGRLATQIYGTQDPPFLKRYAAVAQTGLPQTFETCWAPLKKHFQISAFCPGKGKFATVFTDISDRKIQEEELRQGREELSITLQAIGDAVIVTDCAGCISLMNPVAQQLTGWTMEAAVGRPLNDVFHIINEYTREPVENPVEKVMRENRVVGLGNHTVLIARDGREYFIDDSGAPIRDANGNILGVVLVFRDVSEKRAAESDLRKLAEAVGQASDGVVLSNRDGSITYANPAFEQISGYLLAEILGRKPRILRSGLQDEVFYKALWDTILEGRRWTGRIVNKRKDGRQYTADCSITPVIDAQGTIVNFVWLTRDVTEAIRLEERLNQAQKMEAIGTLAGGIAHDFNNILFPLMGFAEMLREDLPADSPLQVYVEEVLQAAARSKDLVQQILAFSRKAERRDKPVRLQSIFKEAIKLLRATIPTTIDIQQGIEADCPPVIADPTQIHQIVMNLATNAFHAMEETGGTLTVSLRAVRMEGDASDFVQVAAGSYAYLCVADTGAGMPPDVLAKVFDPYFTTKSDRKGTGLGLSVVHGIVKSYGGDIRITSEPGVGTDCHVYLPLAEIKTAARATGVAGFARGGTERILVVDDEESIVRMEWNMLERLGYHVTARTSSIGALDLFKCDPDDFDLLLTDMTMPQMTGLQLAQAVKTIRPGMPVIICTGFSEQIDEERCREADIQDLIMKPISKTLLAQVVRKILDEAGGGQHTVN